MKDIVKAKLTPADNKFIVKFLDEKVQENFEAEKLIRTNKYSGESVEVDPICAAAIDFVFRLENAMRFGDLALKNIHPDINTSNAVSLFDRARMIVCKLDSNAYMTLLD